MPFQVMISNGGIIVSKLHIKRYIYQSPITHWQFKAYWLTNEYRLAVFILENSGAGNIYADMRLLLIIL